MTGEGHRRPSRAVLYTLLTLMVSLWAFNFVAAKFVLRELPGMLAAGLRAMLAGGLMVPLYFWKHRNGRPVSWQRAEVPILLMLGVFGVAANQLFFVLGMARTSVAHAAIIVGMGPILVLLISAALGDQRLSLGEIAGMLVALAGVGLIQIARTASKGTQPSIAGDLLVFLSSAAFAAFVVAGKRYTRSHDAITVNTFAYVGGALALLPTTLWLSRGFDFTQVSTVAYLGLFFMAAFSSVLCYIILYYALSYIPAARVSAFSYLQPFMATLLAIPFLGERPTGALALGGALVLTGVFVTERT